MQMGESTKGALNRFLLFYGPAGVEKGEEARNGKVLNMESEWGKNGSRPSSKVVLAEVSEKGLGRGLPYK